MAHTLLSLLVLIILIISFIVINILKKKRESISYQIGIGEICYRCKSDTGYILNFNSDGIMTTEKKSTMMFL
jgi:hypothetical protein